MLDTNFCNKNLFIKVHQIFLVKKAKKKNYFIVVDILKSVKTFDKAI